MTQPGQPPDAPQGQPQPDPHSHAAPEQTPEEAADTAEVAGWLAAAASVYAGYQAAETAHAAITALLAKRYRLDITQVRLLVRTTTDQPEAAVIPLSPAVRQAYGDGPTRRAAYLINAARRLATSVPTGQVTEQFGKERRYFAQHRTAQQKRMQHAITLDGYARTYGPLLGWNAVLDDRVTPECLAADGKNFYATHRPGIGFPGEVHGASCRCYPSRPHATDELVDPAARPRLDVAAASDTGAVELAFDEKLHPRGPGGKWTYKAPQIMGLAKLEAYDSSGKLRGKYYGTGLTKSTVRHPDDLDGPMYHGTKIDLTGKDIEPGHPGNFVKRMKHVYLTSDLAEARHYAGPTGYVYQVQPTGFYGHRADAKGTSWASEDPLKIVRAVPDTIQASRTGAMTAVELADVKPGQRFMHGWVPINPATIPTPGAPGKVPKDAPRLAGYGLGTGHGMSTVPHAEQAYFQGTPEGEFIATHKPGLPRGAAVAKDYRDRAKTLDGAEQEAIIRYQTPWSWEVNNDLRHGHAKVEDKDSIDALDRAGVAYGLPVPVILNRGLTDGRAFFPHQNLAGKVIQDEGFGSTSIMKSGFDGDVHFHLLAPAGTPGIATTAAGIDAGDAEFVLGRGYQIAVSADQLGADGNRHITGTVLPHYDRSLTQGRVTLKGPTKAAYSPEAVAYLRDNGTRAWRLKYGKVAPPK